MYLYYSDFNYTYICFRKFLENFRVSYGHNDKWKNITSKSVVSVEGDLICVS